MTSAEKRAKYAALKQQRNQEVLNAYSLDEILEQFGYKVSHNGRVTKDKRPLNKNLQLLIGSGVYRGVDYNQLQEMFGRMPFCVFKSLENPEKIYV